MKKINWDKLDKATAIGGSYGELEEFWDSLEDCQCDKFDFTTLDELDEDHANKLTKLVDLINDCNETELKRYINVIKKIDSISDYECVHGDPITALKRIDKVLEEFKNDYCK